MSLLGLSCRTFNDAPARCVTGVVVVSGKVSAERICAVDYTCVGSLGRPAAVEEQQSSLGSEQVPSP